MDIASLRRRHRGASKPPAPETSSVLPSLSQDESNPFNCLSVAQQQLMQQQMQAFVLQQMANSSESSGGETSYQNPTPDQIHQIQQSFFLSMWASAHGGLPGQQTNSELTPSPVRKTSLEAILSTVQQSDSGKLDGTMLNTAEALLQLSGTDDSSGSPVSSTGSLEIVSTPIGLQPFVGPQPFGALRMPASPINSVQLAQPLVASSTLGPHFPSTRAMVFGTSSTAQL